MTDYAYLIPVFPLVAFAVNIFFGRLVREKAAWISIVASLMSCAVALPCVAAVAAGGHYSAEWHWLTLGNYNLTFGYLLDPLSAILQVLSLA